MASSLLGFFVLLVQLNFHSPQTFALHTKMIFFETVQITTCRRYYF